MSAIQQFQQSFIMRHSVFKNSLFWLQWFPFLFAAHQSFLFAAFDFCLQRSFFFLQHVPCGQSYIWARVVCKYMRVSICLHATDAREEMDTSLEKTHRAEKIASIRGKKKLHVYCVIILKLMADHTTKSAIRMVAMHTLHAYKARVLGIERKSCFPMLWRHLHRHPLVTKINMAEYGSCCKQRDLLYRLYIPIFISVARGRQWRHKHRKTFLLVELHRMLPHAKLSTPCFFRQSQICWS